jgi:hypothetical protein
MSINNFFNKIKGKYGIDNITIMYLFVIIGVGVSSFLLGRLSIETNQIKGTEVSIINTKDIPKTITDNKFNSNISIDNPVKEKRFVASKNGKLYYPSLCKGAQRIAEKNRVWFDSSSEAEKLGYTLSPNCK